MLPSPGATMRERQVSVRGKYWTIRRRPKDKYPSHLVNIGISMGDPPESRRHVQVTVSPTGRSIRVWLDNTELKAADDG